MLLPNEWIENSLETYIYQHNTKSHIIYWVALSAITLAIVLLPFIYVDISVQGNGVIRPVTEKTEIKASVSELVDEIYIKEGQHVNKGDVILRFRTDASDDKISYQRERINDFQSQIADLSHLSKGHSPALFQSSVRRQEYNSYIQKQNELGVSIEQARREYTRSKVLFDKALISEEEYDKYRLA